MLVLTRRPTESIIIAGNIKITVVSVGPGRVKLGIEAPADVRIDRQEIHDKIEQASDVLSAITGGDATVGSHHTMVSGPDTALIVPANPADAPTAAPAPAAPAPVAASALNRLSKYRLPRKPR